MPAPLVATNERCPLTRRELEVLVGVAQGLRSRDLADSLHITERSVVNCVSRILQKLGVPHRTAAVVLAHQRRWLDLDDVSLAGCGCEGGDTESRSRAARVGDQVSAAQ